jgi:Family of unknown function (DUF6356)
MLRKIFIDHPETVGESYGEHLAHASGFGFAMLAGGLACLCHAVIPASFERTGSRIISGLHDRMVRNRRRQPEGTPQGSWDYCI